MNTKKRFDISIIIPVYNVEDYITQCLDSVFNQNNINIQVIIVNDGSKDNSHKIIEKYLNLYENIVYIQQKNQGLSMARNNGLKYALGEYVMFLDSDDYIEDDSIYKIYNKSKENDVDVLIFGYRKFFDNIESKSFDVINNIFEENKIYKGDIVAQRMLTGDIKGYCWDKLFKLEYINKCCLKFEPNIYIEDYFPVFKMIYKSKKIGFTKDIIYNYRQRENSISNSKNEKLLKDFILSVDNVLEYIKQYNITFDSKYIDAYKIESFNFILSIFYELNKNISNKIYSKFNDKGYKSYQVSLSKVLINKYINKKTKIAMFLWYMKIYHIFMPNLRNMKKKLRLKLDLDI
nr:glycosyltransferase family 2 protein [uncultured Romboutsia sp.]